MGIIVIDYIERWFQFLCFFEVVAYLCKNMIWLILILGIEL